MADQTELEPAPDVPEDEFEVEGYELDDDEADRIVGALESTRLELQEDEDWPVPPDDLEEHGGQLPPEGEDVGADANDRPLTIPAGFPASKSPSRIGVRSFRVPGTGTSIPCRADIAPLIIGFGAEFHRLVEPLRTGWCWGYAYRAVRGANSTSFHAAGIAADWNAPRHPLGKVGTFSPRQRAVIRALCRKYGLRWGGDYRGRKDEMHVEVIINRSAAVALARRVGGGGGGGRPAPGGGGGDGGPAGGFPLPRGHWYGVDDRSARSHSGKRAGDKEAIRAIQREVGVGADGGYGRVTRGAVARWQRAYRLAADGRVGPKTWAAMVSR